MKELGNLLYFKEKYSDLLWPNWDYKKGETSMKYEVKLSKAIESGTLFTRTGLKNNIVHKNISTSDVLIRVCHILSMT